MTYIEQIDETVAYLRQRLQGTLMPTIAITLGSGLGRLADSIADAIVIPYGEIPNFKRSTSVGHKGNLIVGTLGGKRVMAMQGRFHYYEGYTMQEVTFPERIMSALGIQTLFVSNAAGALNPAFRVGDMMVITDHINFMPNPLIGPNLSRFGVRFPDMTNTYSRRLRSLAEATAAELGYELQYGIYIAGTGPSYETPAEYRMFGLLGGDAVGMSTIPEVIVARHCGMEVFGMSIITNQSNDLCDLCTNDEDDVVLQADRAAERMSSLFAKIIERL